MPNRVRPGLDPPQDEFPGLILVRGISCNKCAYFRIYRNSSRGLSLCLGDVIPQIVAFLFRKLLAFQSLICWFIESRANQGGTEDAASCTEVSKMLRREPKQ